MIRWCLSCAGSGRISDPNRRWWQWFKAINCPACGGDGRGKPPGWPDEAEMKRMRPKPPPAPPLPPPARVRVEIDDDRYGIKFMAMLEKEARERREFMYRFYRKEYSHPLPPREE